MYVSQYTPPPEERDSAGRGDRRDVLQRGRGVKRCSADGGDVLQRGEMLCIDGEKRV